MFLEGPLIYYLYLLSDIIDSICVLKTSLHQGHSDQQWGSAQTGHAMDRHATLRGIHEPFLQQRHPFVYDIH